MRFGALVASLGGVEDDGMVVVSGESEDIVVVAAQRGYVLGGMPGFTNPASMCVSRALRVEF